MAPPIIVFDLDGTLVETAPDLLDSLNHCLGTLSLDQVNPAEIRRYGPARAGFCRGASFSMPCAAAHSGHASGCWGVAKW